MNLLLEEYLKMGVSLSVPLPGNGGNPITALTDVTVGDPVTAQDFLLPLCNQQSPSFRDS